MLKLHLYPNWDVTSGLLPPPLVSMEPSKAVVLYARLGNADELLALAEGELAAWDDINGTAAEDTYKSRHGHGRPSGVCPTIHYREAGGAMGEQFDCERQAWVHYMAVHPELDRSIMPDRGDQVASVSGRHITAKMRCHHSLFVGHRREEVCDFDYAEYDALRRAYLYWYYDTQVAGSP